MNGYRSRPHAIPPERGTRLLQQILPEDERAETMGDFEERFQAKVFEKNEAAARVWYWIHIVRLVAFLAREHFYWSFIMWKSNLTAAWRHIRKNMAYTGLNVLGLAVGMAVFIVIILFVRTELSYDRYHANAKNIYRVIQEQPGNTYLGFNLFAVTAGPMAPAMVRDFPEVRTAMRINRSREDLISIGETNFIEKTIHWADPQIFEIFSFPIVRGDKATSLRDPFSVLLSEREARRLFGGADPISRTIVYRAGDQAYEFKVTGVFRDIPSNSHFTMDVVAPFETMGKIQKRDLTQWGNNSYYTYVLLKDGADPKALDAKLPAFIDKNAGDKIHAHQGQKNRYFLQPLTQIHLTSRVNFEISPTGDARFVLLFASIAVLVLIIACVNYMNLATARSLKRAKEVGLRKVVGADKGQLVRQFLGDAILLTFIALILAVGIVLAVMPVFRNFVEREIAFNPLRDLTMMPGLILLAIVVGVIAGSYPAFFVSAFRPVSALKGTGASKAKGRGLRNGLIVFQFAASIALIICTVAVRSQLRFIRNMDMGYERDQIVVLSPRGGMRTNLEAFKTELKRNPSILNIAASSDYPNSINSSTYAGWPGKPESVEIPIYVLDADYDFIDLYGLKLTQGRNFSRDFPSDAKGAFLINESAAKAIGWEDPIGREFGRWGNQKAAGTIIGVIKDFHMHSVHLPIMPLYIYLDPTRNSNVSVKIRGENIPATIAFLRKTWEKFSPEYPFEYSFFDEVFDRAYRVERRLGTVFSAFAGLAVLIACLGLIGLASFTAEQKTKEVGIRKVLGASSAGIMALFSKEFIKWVVLANLVAWPVGYYAMRTWLKNFAYRIDLTVPMFLGSALAALAIAAAVVSVQTYRAASANPADSLRNE
jgi:putative ABC transport system permease protein